MCVYVCSRGDVCEVVHSRDGSFVRLYVRYLEQIGESQPFCQNVVLDERIWVLNVV